MVAMFVIKRDGREEPVSFDKITARINKLSYGLNAEHCDPGTSTSNAPKAARNAQAPTKRSLFKIKAGISARCPRASRATPPTP